MGTKQRDERRPEVAEMNMLRRILGVTRRDRLRNMKVRERTGVQENIVTGLTIQVSGHPNHIQTLQCSLSVTGYGCS